MIIQERHDDGLDKDGSNDVVKNGWILYILTVEPTGVVKGLDMWHDRNRGVKTDPKGFAGPTEMAKSQEEQIWRKGIRNCLGHIKLEMPIKHPGRDSRV